MDSELDPRDIIEALRAQISDLVVQIAARDAYIAKLQREAAAADVEPDLGQ